MKNLLCGAAIAALALCTFSFAPSAASAQTVVAVPSVTASIGVDHKVDFCTQGADENVAVTAGDSITLTRKFKPEIGLYDPSSGPRVSGDVLKMEQHLQHIDPDTIQVAKFQTLKVGTAGIEIVDFRGKLVCTINVKVQPRIDAAVATPGHSGPAQEGTGEMVPPAQRVLPPEFKNAKPMPLPSVPTSIGCARCQPAIAKPAKHSAIVVPALNSKTAYITVKQGQEIFVGTDASSLDGVSVANVKHCHCAVLQDQHRTSVSTDDEFKGAQGFAPNLEPADQVYTAIGKGRATLVVTVTRPTLGGVRSHWSKTIHVTVK